MFLVGAGALHIPLLSQCGLELGLGLRQDQRAHQPVLELDGEDADLLSIGLHVLRQDLPLGARTLSMSCPSGKVTVVNQEQLLSKLYSGCTLPANYLDILTS